MVISNQPESARPVGSYQKFPHYETRKNIMSENGLLFQHRHFLHDKFLVNDESLQIHVGMGMLSQRLRSIAAYCRFYIVSEMHLGDYAHNVDQWIILNT